MMERKEGDRRVRVMERKGRRQEGEGDGKEMKETGG